jgi:hypothetical protein
MLPIQGFWLHLMSWFTKTIDTNAPTWKEQFFNCVLNCLLLQFLAVCGYGHYYHERLPSFQVRSYRNFGFARDHQQGGLKANAGYISGAICIISDSLYIACKQLYLQTLKFVKQLSVKGHGVWTSICRSILPSTLHGIFFGLAIQATIKPIKGSRQWDGEICVLDPVVVCFRGLSSNFFNRKYSLNIVHLVTASAQNHNF